MFSVKFRIVLVMTIVEAAAKVTHGTSSSSVYHPPKPEKLVRQVYWETYFEFQPTDNCEVKSYWKRPNFELLTGTGGEYDEVIIAFADPDIERCQRKSLFCPNVQIVCGIELYDDLVGQSLFDEFKTAIDSAQKNGTRVKLAFGGEDYGNIR